MQELAETRGRVAAKVRTLRKERRWTQAELAEKLGLSQGRLSEIERGAGSFTAEQLLLMLRLFNVPASTFGAERERDEVGALQNALARLGAEHLHENDQMLPSERLTNVHAVVCEVLASGHPRLLPALAPVLVQHADVINLRKLDLDLAQSGLERRLSWIVDSTLNAIEQVLADSPARQRAKRLRRATILLQTYLDAVIPRRTETPVAVPDIIDPQIRSKRTLVQIRASLSASAQRWGIVTSLHPEDFVSALKCVHENTD